MPFAGHIPYNPQTDPKQYLAQALQQYGQTSLARRQRQQFQKGFSPTMEPMQLMQLALQSGKSPQEAMGLALGQAQTQDYRARAEARLQPKASKIQELTNEGYSLDEARMIRDISHGLKPRASARKRYDNMSDVEKLNFLSTLKQRAEGQYYGIDPELGGLSEPRQPKLLKWVNEEIAKLPMLSETQGAPKAQTAPAQRPPKPTDYPDAEWSEEHGMWTVIRNGRLKGIK